MMTGNMDNMQISVCKVPDGNGFRIESMPDFLLEDTFDDCSRHTHNFYEILWFKEGKGKHMVDFVEYDVKPNTLFFLSPGQIHHFDHHEGYCGITIKMCTDFMKDESATDSLFVKYNVFHTFDTVPYYRLDEATAEVLSRTVEAMKVEAQNNGSLSLTTRLLRLASGLMYSAPVRVTERTSSVRKVTSHVVQSSLTMARS